MSTVVQVLYAISNALLVPVALALLALALLAAALLGGIVREWPVRRRWRLERSIALQRLRQGVIDLADLPHQLHAFPHGEILTAPPIAAEVLARCLQQRALRSLSWLSLGSRAGPALGLMGTLIPLGPGLTALARGDVEMLSARLVVAFTTTVLGLFVGLAFFAMSLVRRRWYAEDAMWLELLLPGPEAGPDGARSALA